MLYDKRWDHQERPSLDEMWSLDRFAAWLRTKPRLESYSFVDPSTCALAQYFQHNGFTEPDEYRIPIDSIPVSFMGLVNCGSYATFGSCLRRVEWLRMGRWGRIVAILTGRAPNSIERWLVDAPSRGRGRVGR